MRTLAGPGSARPLVGAIDSLERRSTAAFVLAAALLWAVILPAEVAIALA